MVDYLIDQVPAASTERGAMMIRLMLGLVLCASMGLAQVCNPSNPSWRVDGDFAYCDTCGIVYELATGKWAAWNGHGYSSWKIGGCPIAAPAVVGDTLPLTGVDWDKLGGSKYLAAGGKRISRQDAFEAVERNGLVDESSKRRIAVIGAKADRQVVLNEIGRVPWAVITAHDPDDWRVARYGFKTDGRPTVYIQEADGKVVHRQDDAKDVAIAVRRADPNYDPAKDPDLRNNPLAGDDKLPWGGGGFLAGVLLPLLAYLIKKYGPLLLKRGPSLADEIRQLRKEMEKPQEP